MTDVLLESLQNLVDRVTAPGTSPVYRTLYGSDGNTPRRIDSWETWRALPVLTKEYVQSYPLAQRTSVPWQELDSVYVSSGTSGKPPIFSARIRIAGYEYRTEIFPQPRGFLSSIGQPHRQEYWMSSLQKRFPVIALDPRNIEASVRLAKAARVDGMYLYVHLIPAVGELMKKYGIAQQIRFLEFAGESCSKAMYEYARATFPHATLASSIGATEIEDAPFAISQRGQDLSSLQTYRAKSGCLLELIDPESGVYIEPNEGAEGELLVTTHAEGALAFPMVRYHIGDRVRVIAVKNETFLFTPVGRNDVDFVKIAGGILHAKEIERVLSVFDPSLEEFEAHLFEHPSPSGPRLQLCVQILSTSPLKLPALADHLSRTLRIGPTFTYENGVQKGMYEPLTCELVHAIAPGKKRRIVKHEYT